MYTLSKPCIQGNMLQLWRGISQVCVLFVCTLMNHKGIPVYENHLWWKAMRKEFTCFQPLFAWYVQPWNKLGSVCMASPPHWVGFMAQHIYATAYSYDCLILYVLTVLQLWGISIPLRYKFMVVVRNEYVCLVSLQDIPLSFKIAQRHAYVYFHTTLHHFNFLIFAWMK